MTHRFTSKLMCQHLKEEEATAQLLREEAAAAKAAWLALEAVWAQRFAESRRLRRGAFGLSSVF